MADEIVYDYVMMLRSVARMVRPDPTLIAPIRDANDVVVVQTAIGGGADIICTVDNDFFMPPADAFLRAANVRVLTDAELMRLLRS
jgi:predicted nucleic acid-binding protein